MWRAYEVDIDRVIVFASKDGESVQYMFSLCRKK